MQNNISARENKNCKDIDIENIREKWGIVTQKQKTTNNSEDKKIGYNILGKPFME